MDADNPPVAYARDGDLVCFDVIDGFSGLLNDGTKLFSSLQIRQITHITGPLYIREACPGDLLKVTIKKILLEPEGVMIAVPGKGAFGAYLEKEAVCHFAVDQIGGTVKFSDELQLNLSPMVGVIGVAPDSESIRAGIPGEHGANMDCNRIGEGATVYLPVKVPGALLGIGDLHALQGDGELAVCGLEIGGSVQVKVEVVKSIELPTPMVVRDGIVSIIGVGETWDLAAQNVLKKIFFFIKDNVPYSAERTAMLLSLTGQLRVCQIVNQKITLRLELPIDVLTALGCRIP